MKVVLALPIMASSAQTHKSMSFIWIVWSTLYVYLWWYTEKVMITYSYKRGFMSNSHKKSWMVSNSQAAIVCAECVNLLEKFKSSKRYTEEFFSKLSCTMGSNQFWRTIRICLFKGWCVAKVGYASWVVAAAADIGRVVSYPTYARYQSFIILLLREKCLMKTHQRT